MKKTFITLVALMSFAFAGAQDNSVSVKVKGDSTGVDSDTMVIKTKAGKFVIEFYPAVDTSSGDDISPKERTELRKFWSGIDFGFNGYLTEAGGTSMKPQDSHFDINQGKSTYWGFNLFEKGIPLYKNKVALVTGLGIDYNNYRFKANSNPFSLPDSLGKRETKDYVTNRLKTFYATVPLMLAFDFSKRDRDGFRLALGVVGGVRFFSYTKEKITVDGDIMKINHRSDFDLNPFRLNAHARLSYGNFTLFAGYSLTPMFKNMQSLPDVYPFQFGISLGS